MSFTLEDVVSFEKKREQDAIDGRVIKPDPDQDDAAAVDIVKKAWQGDPAMLNVRPKHHPQEALDALRMARETGVPVESVLNNQKEALDLKRKNENERLIKEAPSLAKWMMENGVNNAAGREAIKEMGEIEKIWRSIKQSYKRGNWTTEMSDILWRELRGETISDEDRKRVAELERLTAGSAEYETSLFSGASGLISGTPAAMFEQIAIMKDIYGTGALGAGIGAVAGAAKGAVVGGAPGAGIGALAGAGLGFRAFSAFAGGKIEASLAYGEFSKIKDENGVVLDINTARGAAVMVGVVNGSLELVGLSTITRTIPGMRALTRVGAKRVLKDLTRGAAFRTYARNVGLAIAGEGATEAMQEMVTATGQTLLQLHQSKELEQMSTDDIAAAIFSEENLRIAKEAAIKGAQAGGGITTLTSAPAVAIDYHKAKAAEFRKVELKAIDELQKKNKLKEVPEETKKIVDGMVEEGEDNSVYVDPDKFEEYFQSQDINPDEVADEIMGQGGAAELAAAKSEGRDVKIKMADYINKVAGTEHGEFFQDEIKPSPDEVSAREGRESIEQAVEEEKKVSKEEAKRVEEEAKLRKKTEDQLREIGYGYDAVAAYTDLRVSMARALAERSGKSIAQFDKDHQLNIQYGEITEPTETTMEEDVAKVVSDWQKQEFEQADIPKDVFEKLKIREAEEISRAESPKQKSDIRAKYRDIRKAIRKGEDPGKFSKILGEFFQKGGKKRGRLRVETDISGRKRFNIDIFKDADLSTFTHELTHYSLEVMGEIATAEGADPILAEDFNKILKYLGAKDRFSITREQHEYWARSGEAYLMEGKAPTQELQPVFSRFARWLKQIYQTIRGLNVTLTPEVREVFDRMFATDAEIEAGRRRAGAFPLFRDLAEAGFTGADIRRYNDALEGASDEVRQKLESKYRAQVEKKQLRWWKDEKKKVLEEVRKELNNDKRYVALQALSHGELPDGTPIPKEDRMKINKASLLEFMDNDDLKALPRPLPYTSGAIPRHVSEDLKKQEKAEIAEADTEEKKRRIRSKFSEMREDARAQHAGIGVGFASEFFGFDSPEEMMAILTDLAPIKEYADAQAEKIMEKRFGPKINEAEVRLYVDEAMNNNKQASIMEIEIKHLASEKFAKHKKLTRKLASPPVTHKAVKETAKKIIAGKKIRDISPLVYQRAQAKASRESIKAYLEGNYISALNWKKKQLLAFALHKESLDAKARVERHLKYLSKFKKRETREKIGKAQGGYLEQIEGILEKISLKKVSIKKADQRARLANWIIEQEKAGESISVPQKLLDEAFKTDYRNLLSGDFTEIAETVKTIETMAKLKNELIGKQEKRDLQRTVSDMTMGIAKFHDLKERPVDYNPSFLRRALDTIDSVVAQHKKIEFIAHYLDGNKEHGPVWRNIVQPMEEARDKEYKLVSDASARLDKIIDRYTKKEQRDLYTKKIAIPSIAGGRLTKQQILVVALNTLNEYNKSALLEGEGWTTDTLDDVLSHMTEKDWQVVEGISQLIESFWPMVAEQEKQLTGIVPKKVKGENILTPYGGIKGGYFPIVFDPARSSRQEQLDEKQSVQDLYGGGYAKAMTEKGHTIERKGTGGKPLLLDLSVISSHIKNVSHDLAYRTPVINTNKILADQHFMETVEGAVGKNTAKQFHTWLHAVAVDQRGKSIGKIGKFFSAWRMGETAVVMGFKMSTSLFQPLGYTISTKELGYGWALNGLYQSYFGKPTKIFDLHKMVVAKSSFMAGRLTTNDRDIHDTLKKLDKSGGSLWNKAVSKAFLPIGIMDMAVSLPTWIAAYNKALSGEVEHIAPQNEKEAIEYADTLVRTTQGDGAIQNLAAVQRGDQIMRSFTMFYSFMSLQFNQFLKSQGQLKLDGVKGAIPYINAMMLTQILPEILTEIMMDRIDEEEKENIPKYVAKKAITSPLRGMVGVRDAVSFFEFMDKRANYTPSPLVRTVENAGRVYTVANQLIAGEKDFDEISRYDVRATMDLAGAITRLPTRQMFVTSDYFYAWLVSGQETPEHSMEILYRGFVTGRERKKK